VQPLVVTGAALACPFGTAPATLTATPPPVVSATAQVATVTDTAPGTNVPPFGMCTTPSNPAVAAATSAALGVLTPQPCLPVLTGPWAPGSPVVTVQGRPAFTAGSTCTCAWGGVVAVTAPGQTAVTA
jgi:uncharacterized Zn-binding protein involved in type VI secretion